MTPPQNQIPLSDPEVLAGNLETCARALEVIAEFIINSGLIEIDLRPIFQKFSQQNRFESGIKRAGMVWQTVQDIMDKKRQGQ